MSRHYLVATAAQWATAMDGRWGARAAAVKARYSLARFAKGPAPAVTQSYVEADADERVACPLRTMATLAGAGPLAKRASE